MGETRVKKPKKVSKDPEGVSKSVGKRLEEPNLHSNPETTSSSTSEKSAFYTSSECLSPVDDDKFFTADPSYLEVRDTEQKGVAVFAARKIPAGTLILAETPLIRLTQTEEDTDQDNSTDDDDDDRSSLTVQFAQLPKPAQKSYLHLYDSHKSGFSQVKSIYYSNCYNLSGANKPHAQSAGGSCIGATASRFNHSCLANVQFSFSETHNRMLFHTVKAVPRGRELVSNYDATVVEGRRSRHARHAMYYGFRCDCEACDPGPSAFWLRSDARRSAMRVATTELARCERRWTEDRAALRSARDEETPLALLRGLEALMLKEGVLGIHLADVYRCLATWAERLHDDTVLRRARLRELHVCTTILGARSVRVLELRLKLDLPV